MARIRNVKPEFYSHEELNDLESGFPGLRPMLVFSGLWGQCEYSGVFLWSIRKLKLAILPFIDFDIGESLELLEKHGFIRHYRNGGREYGHVVNFTKYQAVSGSEKSGGLKYPLPGDKNSAAIPARPGGGTMTEPGTDGDGTVTEPGTDGDGTMTEPGTDDDGPVTEQGTDDDGTAAEPGTDGDGTMTADLGRRT
ncbi:MAG: hypothetical protein LBU19_03940 [Treponema sp.]|jgi:hypothetical protein|nr:hypothetical protein [Treponema sp.]